MFALSRGSSQPQGPLPQAVMLSLFSEATAQAEPAEARELLSPCTSQHLQPPAHTHNPALPTGLVLLHPSSQANLGEREGRNKG